MDRRMSRCPTGHQTVCPAQWSPVHVSLPLPNHPWRFPCVQLDLQPSLCPSVLAGHAPVAVSMCVPLPSLPWGVGGDSEGPEQGVSVQLDTWTGQILGVQQPPSPSNWGGQGWSQQCPCRSPHSQWGTGTGTDRDGHTAPATPSPPSQLQGLRVPCGCAPGGAGQAPIPRLQPAAPFVLVLPQNRGRSPASTTPSAGGAAGEGLPGPKNPQLLLWVGLKALNHLFFTFIISFIPTFVTSHSHQ